MLIELVNLGRDSELKYSSSGSPILNFAAAYDVGFGENKKTQWIDCVIFGKKAEALVDHLTKGKQVQISARDVRIETWQKNDGTGEGFKLCCTVDDVKFCRNGQGGQNNGQQAGYSAPQQGHNNQPQQQQRPPQRPAPQPQYNEFDDDIPF
jgi:single-strand DNA-binding protein